MMEQLLKYLRETSVFRKLFDVVIASLLLLIVSIGYEITTKGISVTELYAGKESRLLMDKLEVDLQVAKQLDRLNVNTRSSRATLFIYHNTKKGIDGLPFFFQSAVLERTQPGVSKEIQNLQDLPISVNLEAIPFFLNKECYSMTNLTNSKVINKNFLISHGIEDIVSCPLYKDEYLVGHLRLDFNNTNRATNIHTTIKLTEDTVQNIGFILSAINLDEIN